MALQKFHRFLRIHIRKVVAQYPNTLQRIAVDHGVPVINTVLCLDNETQARERCLEDKINRGTQAAWSAVEIASVMSGLRGK